MTPKRVRRLLTVRHSLTRHNAVGIISGRLDEPLSDEGRELLREFVHEHGQIEADTVIASPMRRAIETATRLTGVLAASIVVDPAALERSYGELQGLDRDEVKRFVGRVDYLEVGGIRHSLNPPGGESFEEVRARAVAFREHVEAMPAGTILIVSHQVFLQQFHGLLLGVSTHESLAMDIQTLQIDEFALDDGVPVCHELLHPGMKRYRSW
jgi:probable phosphoglycerate mutase